MTDKKIPFDKNFKDVSDENGFAFEFYCQNCGKKIAEKCPECGKMRPILAHFCSNCGNKK